MGSVRGVHLVGSVPLESTEAVLRMAGAELGDHLRSIPDGETTLRRSPHGALLRRRACCSAWSTSPTVRRARSRMRAASRVASEFAIATECGFGRRDPSTVRRRMEIHREVVERA